MTQASVARIRSGILTTEAWPWPGFSVMASAARSGGVTRARGGAGVGCASRVELDDDLERVNVHGSRISLGHPVGATGARILTTLSREMARRGACYGLETMCIGGGQGLAAVFERV